MIKMLLSSWNRSPSSQQLAEDVLRNSMIDLYALVCSFVVLDLELDNFSPPLLSNRSIDLQSLVAHLAKLCLEKLVWQQV